MAASAMQRRAVTRPRLVIFSPLPPVENGIADYCFELLPELAKDFALTLVIDNHVPAPPVADAEVLRLVEYEARQEQFAETPHLYHLGNNLDHEYLLPTLLRRPGIVVLHDISLHHLIDQATLRWGDVDGYCNLLENEYGGPGRVLAEQFRNQGWRERAMFYELPMTRLIASRSRAIIVHSLYAKTKVMAQEPDTPVVVIPHHLTQKAVEASDSLDRTKARKRLGVDPDEILFVSLGFITQAKQIDTVLEVLSLCRNKLPPFRYILAGQDQSDHYDVRAAIEKAGLEDVVEITGYLDEDDFFDYTIAADIVINLRYPTGGETSGTLIRALGVGACVMVVDIGPFAEFPDQACVKLPWSEHFADTFEKSLLDLVADPKQRLAVSIAAKAHTTHHHSLSASGTAYCQAIAKYAEHPVLPWQPMTLHEYPTLARREQILTQAKKNGLSTFPLWFREMAFPLAAPSNDQPSKILVQGEPQSKQLLCRYLGYRDEDTRHVPLQKGIETLKSLERRTVDAMLFEPGAWLAEHEWALILANANRALMLGGVLVVEVPPSEAGYGQTNNTLQRHLAQAGFRVERYLAAPEDISFILDNKKAANNKPDTHQPNLCWQAIKWSEFVEPKIKNLG